MHLLPKDVRPNGSGAVDEAGELYAEKSKFDDDFDQAMEAQKITNAIAKLGRAAAIHLILATQKVQKETISTAIQENISARMCFKMNTLHGSLQVLGSKDALELPSIPGRGIWQHGTEQFTVQVPFAGEKDIELAFYQRGLNIAFDSAKNLQSMLLSAVTDGSKESARKDLLDLDA